MLETIKYLNKHTVKELVAEFPIRATWHPDFFWVNLDYTSDAFDETVKNHPIVRECRGLMLSFEDWLDIEIVARGFDRFFNLGELETNFDFTHFNAYPKLDGSFMQLYFRNGEWRVKTRGSTHANTNTNYKNVTFEQAFWDIFREMGNKLTALSTKYTYLFELTSRYNPVVVRYNIDKLTLLGIRNNRTGNMVDLDANFGFWSAWFSAISQPVLVKPTVNEVEAYVENLDGLKDEGLVLLDRNGERLKVKNATWIKFNKKVWGITPQSAIRLYIDRSPDLDEICTYFPDISTVINQTKQKHMLLYLTVQAEYSKYYYLETQKEFALAVKDLPYAPILFMMRKGEAFSNVMQKLAERALKLGDLDYAQTIQN